VSFKRKVLASLAAAATVAGGLAVAVVTTPAEAAVPATIPLTIKNSSGRSDAVFIYNLGTLLTTGQQGWADANGTFHAWPAGGSVPTAAPDAPGPRSQPGSGPRRTAPGRRRRRAGRR
jgi:hypothetical protein